MQLPAYDAAVRPGVPYGALAFSLAALMTVFLLAHHPVAAGVLSQTQRLDLVIQLGPLDELVHGLLIGVFGLLLYGAIELSLALGMRRASVAGLVAYVMGCASVIGAMLLDGFVTPQAALRIWQEGDAAVQASTASFAVVATCIQVLTKAGLCGMGAGMLFWSATAWNERSGRALAILGIVAGFLPPLVVALGGMRVQPHLLMLLAAAQGAWNLSAAFFLWKKA